eukprot:m.81850 g.81850  ORF g.81850 m.81850 type:complete len:976 (-) comp12070_c0_seq3:1442-4369(-)
MEPSTSINESSHKDISHTEKENIVDFNAVGVECLEGLEKLLTSINEFVQLKDAVVNCDIPRPLHLRLLSVSGGMNQGVNALYHPLYELVRLVELYSQGWEEKGSVLSNLHKTYNTHHRQLQVALSKMQMDEGEMSKLKKDRLMLLWEAVYARAMANQRHGRRWKYLIESYRQRAEKGVLLRYDSDEDDDSGDEEETYETKLPLKHSSKKGKVPELLGAAERRELERRRINEELETLREEVSKLEERNEKMRDKLDNALVKPPVANKGCTANILKPSASADGTRMNNTNSTHELLDAVSEAVALLESRATTSLDDGNDSNATNGIAWKNEDGIDSSQSHIYILEVKGLSSVGLPDVSLEVTVRASGGVADTTTNRLELRHTVNGSLRVGSLYSLSHITQHSKVEFSLYSGVDDKKLMAKGKVDGQTILSCFHIQKKKSVSPDVALETNVLTTTSVDLIVMPQLETFCTECEIDTPLKLQLSFLASPYEFTAEQQSKVLSPLAEESRVKTSRRPHVKKELEEVEDDDEIGLERAKTAQSREDPASQLFDLLDVNAEDLKEATFTMEEMMDLTLLHTKQLQALQTQYEEDLKAIERKYKPPMTTSATVQTDPTEPEVVEKLVEVEKIVEKVVEKIVEVEKVVKEEVEVRVEVPVEVPVYVNDRKSQIHFKHKFNSTFRSPFLERLAIYAKRSLERLDALKKKVEGERDYVLRAQMASKYVLDEEAKKDQQQKEHQQQSQSRPSSRSSVCLPAMFMPKRSGSFSSRHGHAWYPINTPTRSKHQPPSMVSLPPIRLPPLTATDGDGIRSGEDEMNSREGTEDNMEHQHQQQKQKQYQRGVSSPTSPSRRQGSRPQSSKEERYVQQLSALSKTSPFIPHTPPSPSPSSPIEKHTHSDYFHPSPTPRRANLPKSAQYALPQQQQQQQHEPTVYAWRRMKMTNLRESLNRDHHRGVTAEDKNNNNNSSTDIDEDDDLPWPGRK